MGLQAGPFKAHTAQIKVVCAKLARQAESDFYYQELPQGLPEPIDTSLALIQQALTYNQLALTHETLTLKQLAETHQAVTPTAGSTSPSSYSQPAD
ncbi:hypothetical protein BaRGS_00015034 [Batillaria attramentaria]|uniref:Uncharacterized protein n=1 Tax=Batillaria attramentaria TaxID=370345 RepID=A0ABD0L3K8_9CAEN